MKVKAKFEHQAELETRAPLKPKNQRKTPTILINPKSAIINHQSMSFT
jgi:hypothetical protein